MPTLSRLLRRLIGRDSGNLSTTDERVDQLTAELAQLRETTCRAIAIHASLIQDTQGELRRINQTLGSQLEAFNRDAITRDVNLCIRIEVLEKLAAAAPSVFNLKASEN